MINSFTENVRPNPRGDCPQIDPTAYVDPTATLIGLVRIASHVFIGPNVVIRADEVDKHGKVKPIVIEAQSNVQDAVIIHALAGTEVTIGRRTSLAHGAIIHGPCTVAERSFVGFGAVIFQAKVGSGAFIAARAVVQEAVLPPNTFVPSCAFISKDRLSQLGQVGPHERAFMETIIEANLKLVEGYLKLEQTK